MHKLALAASAVALASVMAISTGPASAQNRIYGDVPYNGPTWGMMNPPSAWNNTRYVNRYVAEDLPIVSVESPRYVNYLGPNPIPVVSHSPIIVGTVPYNGPTWGMMNPPGNNYVDAVRYVNYFGGTLTAPIAGTDHGARCEARYQSYDVATNTFLGYDGLRHTCNL